ncbi:hypothetical protein Lal_00012885 [Lupinus albus]|nr:hypothetical protein Lal_00012885 [Lupinus albus]
MCPSLLEPRTSDHPEAYAANIYNNKPPHQQQHYDPPSSSTYNPGWRNQAPFQNNNAAQNRPSYVPPPIQQQRHQMINNPAPTEPFLEELVRQMTMQNMQFSARNQSFNSKRRSQNSDKLPSQTVLNPRNVSAITLRLFCIDEFLNIDFDVPCTSLYTCHACTDSELCDSCIDEFLNTVVDSPTVQGATKPTFPTFFPYVLKAPDWTPPFDLECNIVVQAATKPSFATFFPSVLQAPDWTPPFDLECDITECKRLTMGGKNDHGIRLSLRQRKENGKLGTKQASWHENKLDHVLEIYLVFRIKAKAPCAPTKHFVLLEIF